MRIYTFYPELCFGCEKMKCGHENSVVNSGGTCYGELARAL